MNDLQNLSVDLRRASYFFQQGDLSLAQKFIDRGLDKYDRPEKIQSYILKSKGENNLQATERAMTAAVTLSGRS